MIMVCATLRSLKNPDVLVNVLGLAEVRARWYPISLVAALSLLSGSVQWDSLAAIAYGYAHEALELEQRALPSGTTTRTLENRFCRRLVYKGVLGGAWMPTSG